MSQQLINRSPDLKQLRDDDYDIEVKRGHLLAKSVPYVNSKREVCRGILVCPLGDLSGDVAHQPTDHTAFFIGDHPCNADGSEITKIKHSTERKELAKGVVVNHMFSAKPKPEGKYRDYHHKVTTYVAIITGQARVIDSFATAQTCVVAESTEEDSPFCYSDSSSTRAGIEAITAKVEGKKIAIVGVGGTGSYILDLVSKTPVNEIHIYDGDAFANHNAFRSPGAATLEELKQRPLKATYLRDRYLKMHRRVFAHEDYLDEDNVQELREMSFVFLCLDRGADKRVIVERLVEWKIPFVDVGMGVATVGDTLRGKTRVTTVTPQKNDHWAKSIPLSESVVENDYSRNIQIAELNALNAALAVIKWKKLCGFYLDQEKEHLSMYLIDSNGIANGDQT
jgi:molybdopterin/thiamine biosynthesis adenylyltransferase